MKTTRLSIIAFFIMATWSHAAEPQALTQLEQENVQQLTLIMIAQGIPEEQAQSVFSLMRQNRYQEVMTQAETVQVAMAQVVTAAAVVAKASS